MRYLAAILICLVAWPVTAVATERSIDDLVEAAVESLGSVSYEARMHFLAPYAEGEEQVAHIYHVAPELYHVCPLRQDDHGTLVETGISYIENAEELVRVSKHGDEIVAVEQMPDRSFYIRNALTVKFLRDLASHQGTVILNGLVGDIEVSILRQTVQPEKPYTITVGLDKANDFPVFLQVSDASGAQKVFYEMEVIEYRKASTMDAEKLFMVPDITGHSRLSALRANQLSPDAVVLDESTPGEKAHVSVKRHPSAVNEAEAGDIAVEYELPLYPTWLPDDYRLESLRLLDYKLASGGQGDVKLVYQFEIIGPESGAVLSIFQTRAGELDLSAGSINYRTDSGYVVQERDNWLVTVFGEFPVETLIQIVDGLAVRNESVSELLEISQARDAIRQQVINFSD